MVTMQEAIDSKGGTDAKAKRGSKRIANIGGQKSGHRVRVSGGGSRQSAQRTPAPQE